jgi:HD superfamily phosphohydrolase
MALQRWKDCEDPILSDLSSRIVERRLFKTLDVSRIKNLRLKEKAAQEVISRAGLDPRYYFIIDTSGDIPYKAYDPRRPRMASHIMVDSGASSRDIYQLSEVVGGLARAAFTVKRAIFPATANGVDLRKAMSQIFLATDTSDGFLPGS